jgi:MFS family permease
MGRWSPPFERSRLVGFSFVGADFGTATTMFISGLLGTYWSWESVFYFYGAF